MDFGADGYIPLDDEEGDFNYTSEYRFRTISEFQQFLLESGRCATPKTETAVKEEPAGNFDIVERGCANMSNGIHMIMLRALCKDTGETVWMIGDDRVCAVTREDCVRNPKIAYNSVLIQEFPYKENTPQSVGKWSPLVKELVECMLDKYLEYDGLVHLYPQWLPEQVYVHLGQEVFNQLCEGCDHIILRQDNMMEFVPKQTK